ncbi:MAG: hypothetical protein Q7S61_00830 [bacterium]|nr:hypothetical protein [bacterium]
MENRKVKNITRKKYIILAFFVVVLFGAFFLIFWRKSAINEKSWEKIKSEFSKCTVKSASQGHSRRVEVSLKDGTQLSAIEPKIGDIVHIVNETEKKCGEQPSFITE